MHLPNPTSLPIFWPPGLLLAPATSTKLSASLPMALTRWELYFLPPSLLLFLLGSININSEKFRLALGLFCSHWGRPVHDLQLLSLLSNLCSSSLIPTSIKAQATSLVKSEPECSTANHTVLLFGGRGCLLSSSSFWAPFA